MSDEAPSPGAVSSPHTPTPPPTASTTVAPAPNPSQVATSAKQVVAAETRLNANAKSFTPSAATIPPSPDAPPAAHPPAKDIKSKSAAEAKAPPPAPPLIPPAGTVGAKLTPPPTSYFQPPAHGGKTAMAPPMPSPQQPPPPPPGFPGVPHMPPLMPGATGLPHPLGNYMMPTGFVPPSPPMMMYPPPPGRMAGAAGAPTPMQPNWASATSPVPSTLQRAQPQMGMTPPMWMPPPPPPPPPPQSNPQQFRVTSPICGMMPMPMPTSMPMGSMASGAAPPPPPPPPPPVQRQTNADTSQQSSMMMPFFLQQQAPQGMMVPPAMGGMLPPYPPKLGMASGPTTTGVQQPPSLSPPGPLMSHPTMMMNTFAAASSSSSNIAPRSQTTLPSAGMIRPGPISTPMSMAMPPPSSMMVMMNTPTNSSAGMMANAVAAMMMPPHPLPPPPPPPPPIVPANARVSVGNATLAALNSKEPPKFSCVLLSGIPAVGKTTLGRELVNSLKTDGMGWAFFSGADFLTEQPGKRSVWETTKEIFDALSTRLDELLEKQCVDRNIKGLVIDKNCKGIEDVYYLNELLRSKNIPFVGIVGLESADDAALVKRMGGGEHLKEKLKFHRVIHARIVSLAKSAGMYRYVDATKGKEEVVQMLRTMVLGCCAQPPVRSLSHHQYDDSRANTMVDEYKEYSEVLTDLFRCVNSRGAQFPGSIDLVPLSAKDMKDKGRISALKSRYGIRRKVDGSRYLLIYTHSKLFLVPPHMRAVLRMSPEAWLGRDLDGEKVGMFVLEGDLTRLRRDRKKELFLVYDAHYWSEAALPNNNIMIRMTFAERQTFLAEHLCSEEKASFSQEGSECVVVHQPTRDISQAVDMLDSEDYPSDGLVFQVINPIHRNDHIFVWQQPSSMTVDFRLGELLFTRQPPMVEGSATTLDELLSSQKNDSLDRRHSTSGATTPQHDQQHHLTGRGSVDMTSDYPIRTFELEVYDKSEKVYVQFEDATVDVRHPDVVEGCIVTCSPADETPRRWVLRRVRYDVLRPIYKHDLEELLSLCLIPRARLVSWLLSEQIVPSEIQPDVHATTAAGGTTASSTIPSVPPPSYDAAAAAAATAGANSMTASMGVFPGRGIMPGASATAPPVLLGVSPNMFLSSVGAFGAPTSGAAAPPTTLPPAVYPSAASTLPPTKALPATTAIPIPQTAVAAAMPPSPPPPQIQPLSTEAQLKQLASIVPSFHVVNGGKESPGAAATSASGGRAHQDGNVTESNSAAVSRLIKDGSRTCAQCHKTKQSDDLRVDRRDRKHYCYSCWSKLGFGFCEVCGEFGEIHRETKGRKKGSNICGACAKAAGPNVKAAAASTETKANVEATPVPTATAARGGANNNATVEAAAASAKRQKVTPKAKKAVGKAANASNIISDEKSTATPASTREEDRTTHNPNAASAPDGVEAATEHTTPFPDADGAIASAKKKNKRNRKKKEGASSKDGSASLDALSAVSSPDSRSPIEAAGAPRLRGDVKKGSVEGKLMDDVLVTVEPPAAAPASTLPTAVDSSIANALAHPKSEGGNTNASPPASLLPSSGTPPPASKAPNVEKAEVVEAKRSSGGGCLPQ